MNTLVHQLDLTYMAFYFCREEIPERLVIMSSNSQSNACCKNKHKKRGFANVHERELHSHSTREHNSDHITLPREENMYIVTFISGWRGEHIFQQDRRLDKFKFRLKNALLPLSVV